MEPEKLASVPTPKKICPICKIQIYPATLVDRELLHCAECKGTAWPRETLMKLRPDDAKVPIQLGALEKDHKTPPFFTPRQKPPFLICPCCSKRMKLTKLANTEVDICEKCTCLWIDGPKAGKFAHLLGPYKWRQAKGG